MVSSGHSPVVKFSPSASAGLDEIGLWGVRYMAEPAGAMSSAATGSRSRPRFSYKMAVLMGRPCRSRCVLPGAPWTSKCRAAPSAPGSVAPRRQTSS
jgi:hypothetical protein